jgi:hypothetical protein
MFDRIQPSFRVGKFPIKPSRGSILLMTPNRKVNRPACKPRVQVPSALRAPAADYVARYAAT